jgi:hypothetical protein
VRSSRRVYLDVKRPNRTAAAVGWGNGCFESGKSISTAPRLTFRFVLNIKVTGLQGLLQAGQETGMTDLAESEQAPCH